MPILITKIKPEFVGQIIDGMPFTVGMVEEQIGNILRVKPMINKENFYTTLDRRWTYHSTWLEFDSTCLVNTLEQLGSNLQARVKNIRIGTQKDGLTFTDGEARYIHQIIHVNTWFTENYRKVYYQPVTTFKYSPDWLVLSMRDVWRVLSHTERQERE